MENETYEIANEHYEQEFSRKERLESKAEGYLSFLALFSGLIVAVFIFSLSFCELITKYKILFIINMSLVGYIIFLFMISVVFLVRALSVKKIEKLNFDKSMYTCLVTDKDYVNYKKIIRSLIRYSENNSKINDKTEYQLSIVHIFLYALIISSSIYLLQIFILIVLQWR